MRLGSAGRALQQGGFYTLLVLLPVSKAAIEISCVLLILGWLLERADPATRADTWWATPPARPVAAALLVYLTICALSILVSRDPHVSLRALVTKWGEYLLLFVIAADLGRRPGVAARALLAIAGSAVLVVLEALTQEWLGRGIFRGYPMFVSGGTMSGYGRATGPYENPIDLATYLMVVLPMLLAWAMTIRSRARVWLWAMAALLSIGLIRTEAFGGWLAFAAAVPVALLVGGNRRVRRYGVAAMLGVALAGGAILHQTGHLQRTFSFSWADTGTSDRRHMWEAAVGMIRDLPVLGHGLNTFMGNYLNYWTGGERQPRYAHNCYLQVAAETGIAGLVAFVSLLGLLFVRLAGAIRRVRGDRSVLLVGFIAGLLAFTLQAGIDTNFYALRQATLFWALGGLALGLSATGSAAALAAAPLKGLGSR